MNDLGWEWWAANGNGHITPGGERWPEGFQPGARAADLLAAEGLIDPVVVEFGCGDGRLAGAFDPDCYHGVDVCNESLFAAQMLHPWHDFAPYRPWGDLADSVAVIAWTVLLHLPDADLPKFAALCDGRHVVIGEAMTREWRRGGCPPVFNRNPGEYIDAFPGHSLAHREDSKLERYARRGPPRDTLTVLVLEPK